MRSLLVCALLFLVHTASAQTDSIVASPEIDTIQNPLKNDQPRRSSWADSTHSPKKATIYSAVLPGLGQAYNRKYWKIPVIYAGLGASGYFFVYNNDEYQRTRKALIARLDENPETVDNDFTDPRYTNEFLQERKNYFRRSRDLSAIIGVLVYVANIIDADVDAHLINFSVDDNLSMHLAPLPHTFAAFTLNYRF
jgi:hypothetical protein